MIGKCKFRNDLQAQLIISSRISLIENSDLRI